MKKLLLSLVVTIVAQMNVVQAETNLCISHIEKSDCGFYEGSFALSYYSSLHYVCVKYVGYRSLETGALGQTGVETAAKEVDMEMLEDRKYRRSLMKEVKKELNIKIRKLSSEYESC